MLTNSLLFTYKYLYVLSYSFGGPKQRHSPTLPHSVLSQHERHQMVRTSAFVRSLPTSSGELVLASFFFSPQKRFLASRSFAHRSRRSERPGDLTFQSANSKSLRQAKFLFLLWSRACQGQELNAPSKPAVGREKIKNDGAEAQASRGWRGSGSACMRDACGGHDSGRTHASKPLGKRRRHN